MSKNLNFECYIRIKFASNSIYVYEEGGVLEYNYPWFRGFARNTGFGYSIIEGQSFFFL
ncbi:MAG: hypothetical protein Aureis2KO_12100 [Aureisphaera sp.]